MEHYVWINPERLDRARKTDSVAGIDFSIELSPYDSPKSVVGKYNKDSRQFSIEFEYIDDEPMRKHASHEGVSVFTGKHSGKLMKICIDIDDEPHDKASVIALRTRVLDAVRLEDGPKRGGLNREFASNLLKDEFEELSKAMAIGT